jgi:branched-chain amino acid transport system ATP-binding protein
VTAETPVTGLLAVEGLDVRYGQARAVNGATVRVPEGSITAIVGPNGAGKSTLLKAVSGLQPARGGQIRFRGQRIDGLPSRGIAALGIAHVREGRRIFAKMSVLDNLRLGAYLRDDARGVERTLDMVFEAFPRLRERQTQRAGSLSGGEQQMLAIGRALMSAPRLIMADEMSQGLAPVIVQEVYRRLLEVNRQGVTILLVEQNARLAFRLAQFVYVMEEGRVVLEGPSADVAASEHVQQAYLGGRREAGPLTPPRSPAPG